MRVAPTAIEGVVVVHPDVHRDPRGHFVEAWNAARYRAAGLDADFVQDNRSRSVRGTLRGLHAQRARPQGKLVEVLAGEVYDVAVDLRPGSRTYGAFVATTLAADPPVQLWVPPGFAHGFQVLSATADVAYKCTAPYDPDDEVRIAWDDPDLAIPWPIRPPLLSDKDRAAPRLEGAGYAPRTRAPARARRQDDALP